MQYIIQFRSWALVFLLALSLWGCTNDDGAPPQQLRIPPCTVGLFILGNGQDAGKPQIGVHTDPGWSTLKNQALASSIALIDQAASADQAAHYLFDVTPDIKQQYYNLSKFTDIARPELSGLFLTHAHIGHYLGLAQFGREAMGADNINTYAMPGMAAFLRNNGPWSQLVTLNNIALHELKADISLRLREHLSITPFLVPHRDEYAETVGYKITYHEKSAIYLPDIDSWDQWAALGYEVSKLVQDNDLLFLDASFYSGDELPGRDMSKIPHPTIKTTMKRLENLATHQRTKVHFIHMNHTNPALDPNSKETSQIEQAGFHIARQGNFYCLDERSPQSGK